MIVLKFKYHPNAIIETAEAYNWYLERSPQAAAKFQAELLRAEKRVIETPQTWPGYLHGTQYFLFRGFPYALVFSVEDIGIVGVAVAHLKRRPGYWKRRLTH